MRYRLPLLWLMYLNRDGRAVTSLFLLIPAGITSPLALFGWHALSELPDQFDAEPVTATVVGKHVAGGRAAGPPFAAVLALGGKRPQYVLEYEYTDAAGARHAGRSRVTAARWDRTQPGDQLPAWHARRDPARSRLDVSPWEGWPFLLLGCISPALVAVSAWLGSRTAVRVTRQVWLVSRGEAVPGRFVRAEVEHRGRRHSDQVSVLEYEFAAGGVRKGRVEMQGGLRPNWLAGGVVVVLVNRTNTADHAADVFDARRADRERLFGPAGSSPAARCNS